MFVWNDAQHVLTMAIRQHYGSVAKKKADLVGWNAWDICPMHLEGCTCKLEENPAASLEEAESDSIYGEKILAEHLLADWRLSPDHCPQPALFLADIYRNAAVSRRDDD